MKTLNISLEEAEYDKLWKKKGQMTWKDWLLRVDLE